MVVAEVVGEWLLLHYWAGGGCSLIGLAEVVGEWLLLHCWAGGGCY